MKIVTMSMWTRRNSIMTILTLMVIPMAREEYVHRKLSSLFRLMF